jgi:hypothetical protein
MKMKFLLLLASTLLASQCKTELALDSVPCLENNVPVEWVCYERINYDFCFPPTYRSGRYSWDKHNPYSSLSKFVFSQQPTYMDIPNIDLHTFILSPFPDHITLPENNVLTERIEICDRDHTIGVFYYGKVNNLDCEYEGYLYLTKDEADSKYYLSALSEISKEGIPDILEVVKRIKRHD